VPWISSTGKSHSVKHKVKCLAPKFLITFVLHLDMDTSAQKISTPPISTSSPSPFSQEVKLKAGSV